MAGPAMLAPPPRDWNKGNRFSASHLQEGVRSIRAMLGYQSGLPFDVMADPAEAFPAKILDDAAGPNGKSLTSISANKEQYWAKRQKMKGAKDLDPVAFVDETDTSDPLIVLVTNLPEQQPATHNLKTDTIIWVWAWWDKGVPSGVSESQPDYRNHKHYLTSTGGAGSSLPPGTGKYKVLMLIDDLNPGTPDWDWPRFH